MTACTPSLRPAPVDLAASWTTWMGDAARGGYRRATVPADTPEVIWEATVGSGVRSAPVLTEQAVVVASTNRQLYVFNRQDGSLFWQRSVGFVPGHPLVVGDRIYVATEGAREGEVRRLRFRDGATEWRRRLGSVSAPIGLADGELYGVTDRGIAFALRPYDGSEVWRALLPGRGVALGPVVAGDRVFVISGADTLYSLDRRTGQRVGAAPLSGRPAGLPA
ncbi:MAG: PQQ-like beta-propeller repeat protein, partial [Gemmatimonadetes bacterium]|nr:PQQ-like beta-propeller repeat protein [Gemmatimonadota bacterium]